MKNFLFSFLASALFVVSGHGQTLNIGDPAPSASYKMMNIDGSQLSINDIKGENGALVILRAIHAHLSWVEVKPLRGGKVDTMK